MYKFFLYFVFWILTSTCVFADGKLIFAIDIVRHGDRTPLVNSPEMERIWPQGLGQLTPQGMRQEYELGKILRQRYIDEYHLLPQYYDTNSMNVRSTDMARTLMSAQSLLFGLYPLKTGPLLNDSTEALPKRFQSIPIHTVPNQQDSLLIPSYDKAKYKILLETYIFNSPEWLEKDKELQPSYPLWSEIFNTPITNLFDLIPLYDRLYIENLYALPLPQGLLEKDANTIKEAGKWAVLKIINNPQLALIGGSELAQTIKNEISSAAEKNRPLKYLLFVAHDITLSAQLKILGQTIDDLPPYAAELNYSLFDMGSSNYEVRVTYNQKPLFIKQCGGNACNLQNFRNLMNKGLN